MSPQNPFLIDWSGPFALPPFDQIKDEHFAPAFDAAFDQSRAAINAIADNSAAPTFANTIDALETADELMDKVAGVFFNVSGSDSNDARQALQRDLAPRFAAFSSETMMNEALFKRIEILNENRGANSAEQNRVLELYHRMFVRAGAQLTGDAKKRLPEVSGRLAELGTAFTQNLLKDEADWYMELGTDDLDGLPDFLLSAASEAAKERDIDGHIVTLSRSLIVPFLQFSTRRDLRKIAYIAWGKRGANDGETDNRALAAEMLALRKEMADLLGYDDFASFKLETEMAKTPGNVRDLLTSVWEPAKAQANKDADVLTHMMHQDGINGDLEPWDWRYYAEQRRQAEHDLDEATIKPYFQLDQMIAASFDCANRLFGLQFAPVDVPLYHPDCRAWEVTRDGRHVALFIGDYFARGSKRSGAWCSHFRGQQNLGKDIRPVTVNICNFAKAPAGQPSLLTFDDARTLFHEFGHALHSMLSNVHYAMISGTSVARDFVELPSQLYEHWLSIPSVLEKFALHCETQASPCPKNCSTNSSPPKTSTWAFPRSNTPPAPSSTSPSTKGNHPPTPWPNKPKS